MKTDSEYLILNSLQSLSEETDPVNQRTLSSNTGLSLGMVNAILRRLHNRGWIMMKKASPKKIAYVLTPQGMSELMRRSIKSVQYTTNTLKIYKDIITRLVQKAKKSGYTSIYLIGKSNLDFVIEYVTDREDMTFFNETEENYKQDGFLFFAENIPQSNIDSTKGISLYHVLKEVEHVH